MFIRPSNQYIQIPPPSEYAQQILQASQKYQFSRHVLAPLIIVPYGYPFFNCLMHSYPQLDYKRIVEIAFIAPTDQFKTTQTPFRTWQTNSGSYIQFKKLDEVPECEHRFCMNQTTIDSQVPFIPNMPCYGVYLGQDGQHDFLNSFSNKTLIVVISKLQLAGYQLKFVPKTNELERHMWTLNNFLVDALNAQSDLETMLQDVHVENERILVLASQIAAAINVRFKYKIRNQIKETKIGTETVETGALLVGVKENEDIVAFEV
ncbi:Conserved_hypothetical protein [Hexamita inflata]|uniref:Uncharacterized protein n=1 Tax=Hexamita inflata TaxID=28002 RepID=A0AA86QF59_9EUKA|nr:Conserved hypothetical protein [Hexamita inflata]